MALAGGQVTMPPYMLRPYMFKQVAHWKSGRQGLVINWYDDGWKARKMWVLFEDGEVELRWISKVLVNLNVRENAMSTLIRIVCSYV